MWYCCFILSSGIKNDVQEIKSLEMKLKETVNSFFHLINQHLKSTYRRDFLSYLKIKNKNDFINKDMKPITEFPVEKKLHCIM